MGRDDVWQDDGQLATWSIHNGSGASSHFPRGPLHGFHAKGKVMWKVSKAYH